MFRIDINPELTSLQSRSQQLQSQSQSVTQSQHQSFIDLKKTIYTCIQTSSHNENFLSSTTTEENNEDNGKIILTIGRKDCDVNFGRDKSVSRKHCVIKLFCSNRRKENSESINEACSEADNGMVVMIQELNSKYGMRIRVPQDDDNNDKKKGKGGDDDDEETDDETDDENNNGLSNFSEVKDGEKRVPMVEKKLEKACRMILPQLSHPYYELENNNKDGSNKKSNNVGEVTLFFGVSGSHIRIRRIPLVFTFSRVPKNVQSAMTTQSKLQSIGATVSSYWDSRVSTHLICSEKLSTAKNVSAWACRKSMVTPDFVLALLNRNRPGDALPQEEDFVPNGVVPMDDVDPQLPRKVLSKYASFLSFVADENEHLARAGGATILALYDMKDKEFYQEETLLSFLSIPTMKKKQPIWILLDSSSRRVKKRKDFLLSLLKNKLYLTTAIELAVSISHLQPLNDVNNKPIPFDESIGLTSEVIIPPTMEESQNTTQQKNLSQQQNTIVEVTESQLPARQENANVESLVVQHPQEEHDDTCQLQEDNQKEIQEDIPPTHEQKNDSMQEVAAVKTVTLRPLSEKNGWLTTNSNNPTRQEDPDNPLPEPACSVYQSDLIHITNNQRQNDQSHRHNNASSLLNFKKFRKNKVLYCSRSINNNFPDLQSVFPKETLRQQELHLSQIEKDRKNQQAEMLFQDDAVSITGKKKKRGVGSNSMISTYFSPTSKRRKLVS